jgi:hypothetical protein
MFDSHHAPGLDGCKHGELAGQRQGTQVSSIDLGTAQRPAAPSRRTAQDTAFFRDFGSRGYPPRDDRGLNNSDLITREKENLGEFQSTEENEE